MKSDSPAIPARKLSAYERWELPAVDSSQVVGRDVRRAEEEMQVTPLTAEQVEEIREAARKEGYEQGHQEGLSAGLAEGKAQGEAALKQSAARLREVIGQMMEPARSEEAALEAALIDLVLRISEGVIERELLVDSSVIAGLVREAVDALPSGASRIEIHLHPDDLKSLQAAGFVQDESWKLVQDASLSRGGCRVVSGTSLVDFTTEQRFHSQVDQLVKDRYALVARLYGINEPSSGDDA